MALWETFQPLQEWKHGRKHDDDKQLLLCKSLQGGIKQQRVDIFSTRIKQFSLTAILRLTGIISGNQ